VEQAALQTLISRLPFAASAGRPLAIEEVEMGRLSEELGLVGGHRVDQVDDLGLHPVLLEQVVAVSVHVVDPRRPHPAAQAPLQHGALVGRHLDAAVIVE
jgi:hypothetical protein